MQAANDQVSTGTEPSHSSHLNYDRESGDLLHYISIIAVRMLVYVRGFTGLTEIERLADSIHNLGYIGLAMKSGDHAEVHNSCEHHIAVFRAMAKEPPEQTPGTCAFQPLAPAFWLKGVEIFTAIQQKASILREATAAAGSSARVTE